MDQEEDAPKEDIRHQAEDFAPDSDDEQKHDELLHIADGLKNFADEDAKAKRQQDTLAKENGDFPSMDASTSKGSGSTFKTQNMQAQE